MAVDFAQGGDTGENTDASIQPITNGETVVDSVLNRPAQNLRRRTEVLRTETSTQEAHARGSEGAYVTSDGAVVGISAVVYANADDGIPEVTGYTVVPTVKVVVDSPVDGGVNGGNLVVPAATFAAFYNQAVSGDFSLMKRGDSLAFYLPRAGAGSRVTKTWGNDSTYPALSSSTIGEAELVKLPQRTVLSDSSATNLTTLGVDGTGLFDEDGLPTEDMFVNISEVNGLGEGQWFSLGGRGGRQLEFLGDGVYPDYLKVVSVTETTVTVETDTPFRILWPDANITWQLYNVVAAVKTAVGVSRSTGAVIPADLSDAHLVPLVTFDGNGFSFSPAGGYVPNSAGRRASFQLPATYEDLSSTAALDEGAAAIGGVARVSSSDADIFGVSIAAGTLSAQLDSIVTAVGTRSTVYSKELVGVNLSGDPDAFSTAWFISDLFPDDGEASADLQLVRVWVEVLTAFTTSDAAATLMLAVLSSDAAYTVFPTTNLRLVTTGRLEAEGVANLADWVVGAGNQTTRRLRVHLKVVGGNALLSEITAGRVIVRGGGQEAP